MSGLSKFVKDLPPGFGYVVLVGVGHVFVNMWMAINVGKARKQYEVKYPQMYHTETNHVFNCIQRVHQNTVEGNSQFYFLLLTSGLQYPKVSAIAGAVCIAGRIAFALGYYTGNPDKRTWGAIGHIGDLVLLGGTLSLIFRLLDWYPWKGH